MFGRLSFVLLSLLLALAAGSPAAAGSPLAPVTDLIPADRPPGPSGASVPEVGGDGTTHTSAKASPLVGTFRITAGRCSGAPSGSFFRMIQPGGSASGPFVSNSDSPCADKTYTPLRPGTDGGLITDSYQAQPSPPFDGAGNGRSARITAPQRFYGVDFAAATNPTDPQTGIQVPAPRLSADGTDLSGDLRSFAASWNNQQFNQGAPKPDGSTPGTTRAPSGNIDLDTGAFAVSWTSLIVGGPFNNFTGVWHFEGRFVPREAPSGGAPGAGSAGTGSAGTAGAAAAATAGAATRAGGQSGALAHTGAGPESIAGSILLFAAFSARRLARRARPGRTRT